MKKFVLTLFAVLACCCVSLHATAEETPYSVKLHIVDVDDEPESFATVRIFATGDSVNAAVVGVADSVGIYRAPLPAAASYFLTIEGAGQTGAGARRTFTVSDIEPDADLGTVILGADDQTLQEVSVTAQRPLVTKQIDRIGYDVQADPASKVLTLQEMMRRVPMVSVDAEGNITVNGSSNFKIYKNGKPNNSLTNNAKEILAAIPASMIKRVEVITEPGARYDAEGIGAILNIVTVDDAVINGVTGTASLSVNTQSGIPTANIYLTTQIDKVTFSINGGANPMNRHQTHNVSTTDYLFNDGRRLFSESDSYRKGFVSWFGGEASWDINKHNMLTAEIDGFYFNAKPYGKGKEATYAPDGSVLSSHSSIETPHRTGYLSFNGNVNYQHTTSRAGETLTGSYMISNMSDDSKTEETYSDIVGTSFPYTGRYNDTHLNFIEHTFQFDWTRPFSQIHTLETGAKYIFRRNHSTTDTEYFNWQDTHSDFKHITDVAALYAQYTARVGRVSLRGGLRYELSRLKASYPDGSAESFSSTLNDLVPSASASWQISDVHTLTANYAARINRPGINYLNPAKVYTPTEVNYGNPDLNSAYSNSLKISYMFIKPKLNFSLSANYAFNNDNISEVKFVNSDGLIVKTYDNIGHERNLSFSGFAQWSATSKTQLMFNATASRQSYRQNGMRLAKWGWNAFMRISQNLPWGLTAEGMLYHQARSVNDVYTYGGMDGQDAYFWNLSLRKSFLKENRLTVSLTVSNPIGRSTRNYILHTVNGDYTGTASYKFLSTRMGFLRVSYRFGSLNARVKKTAARISNDDVVGGVSSGSSNGGGQMSN